MTNTAIFISSCDKYQDVWHPFFHFFFKYWSDCPYPIYLMTNFLEYEDSRVISIPVGEDQDWSSGFKKALQTIPESHVIVLMEDYLLTDNVDTEKIEYLVNKTIELDIGCLRISPIPGPDRPFKNIPDVGMISKGSAYRLSLQAAIWNKSTLISLIKEGESAWELELNGTKRTDELESLFLSVDRNKPALNYFCTAVVKGIWLYDAMKMCKKEGITLAPSNRNIETLLQYWQRIYFPKLSMAKIKSSLSRYIKNSYPYNLLWVLKQHLFSKWTQQDQHMLDFYSQFLAPNDLCFDVGANFGNRTKIFRKLGAKVIAVEPQQECADYLHKYYQFDKKVILIQKALGDKPGKLELFLSNATTLATLSTKWIETTKNSGRFAEYEWNDKQTVDVTTLDHIIKQYGSPKFIKIDVEGFELNVLKGLSKQFDVLSIEFAPEFFETTFACIEQLATMGTIVLNYALEESMQLILEDWITPKEMIEHLKKYTGNHQIFGDVYIKLIH